tara:strand:- start:1144 stop:1368 length:225 start_codon:yes stop_codon:yes gene_type:complete
MKKYVVEISIDYLDTKPIKKVFEYFDDAQDYIINTVNNNIESFKQSASYTLSEQDLKDFEQNQYQLIKLKELVS